MGDWRRRGTQRVISTFFSRIKNYCSIRFGRYIGLLCSVTKRKQLFCMLVNTGRPNEWLRVGQWFGDRIENFVAEQPSDLGDGLVTV
jgi:hypothetical protein